MKSYEELLECGESEKARSEFIESAVKEFEGTEMYQNALIADRYYRGHNATIEDFVKWFYTVTGRKERDIYSADYRVKTQYFRRKVIQHANYLAGNGVQLSDPEQKKALGKNIDHKILQAIKRSMVEGRSFGFWNADHLEVFGIICNENQAGFCPIYSAKTGQLMAGIRFTYRKVYDKTIVLYSLFEPEGITEFCKDKEGNVNQTNRTAYKTKTISTIAEGIISIEEQNYNGVLPIVPLYASDTYESDLVGIREAIDCYDMVKNGLANTIDDASEIYWIVKNAGGMNDKDLAMFLSRIKHTHAAQVDADAGEEAEPHTIDVPHDARSALLELLRTDLYDDMHLLDRRSLSAAQKTNQELDMAYQPMDDYINDLEFFVYDFLDRIFALAGLPEDTEATFTRNKISNKPEQTNMVLSSADFISPECIISHLPFLTPEEQEAQVKWYLSEQASRFLADEEGPEEGEEE